MNRLTFQEPDGSFGVSGMNAGNQDQKLYMCVVKLKDYENTGLSPDDVERLQAALREKQEREKGCEACKPCCHNCKHDIYDGFCSWYGTHGCGNKHYEPKINFCANCGRDLEKE